MKQLVFIIIIIQSKGLPGRSPTISISPTAAEVIIVIIVFWAIDPAATLLDAASSIAAAASGAARRLLFRVRNLVAGIYPLAVDIDRMR